MSKPAALVMGAVCDAQLLRTDGVVRGHRSGLLTTADYNNLCQCETLDDIKLNLVRFRGALTPYLHFCAIPVARPTVCNKFIEDRVAENNCKPI